MSWADFEKTVFFYSKLNVKNSEKKLDQNKKQMV